CTGVDVLEGLTGRKSRRSQAIGGERSAGDQASFESLKAVRRRLADDAGVPAYLVFSDATLAEMVARRPTTSAELLDISGVGPKKLETYGDVFLAAIAALSSSVAES
ncbi:MAG: DNA helicase RecQ, partial [Acidimicrobiia bacterium]|nr:DNA helicase RecQ [Acidimicrobiia bacterium]